MAELIRTEPYSFAQQVYTTLFLKATPVELSGPLVLSVAFELDLYSVTDSSQEPSTNGTELEDE